MNSIFRARAHIIGIMLGNLGHLRPRDEMALDRALWYGYELYGVDDGYGDCTQ